MTDSSTRDRAEGMFDQGKGKVKQGSAISPATSG